MDSMKQILRYKSPREKKEDKWFLKNGGIFLEKLIADCNDESIPIRNFSSSQILKATNNFDHSSLANWDRGQRWHKGNIEEKPYMIKRYLKDVDGDIFNDIVLSARMSNHNNFLKLLGCCFKFDSPAVVYEYAEHAGLSEEGCIFVDGEESKFHWRVRLKIAREIAIVVTYLHTAFPRIIIHNAITPTNIFLDKNKNWKAKLTDFRFSINIPEGKSKIEDHINCGTLGYVDPLYYLTGSISEYTDVYSFGICLLVFLTGRSASSFYKELKEDRQNIARYVKGLYENGKLDEAIDPLIANNITTDQRLQVEAFVVLALKCLQFIDEDRPKMIQVAKELKRIELIEQSLNANSAIGLLKYEMLEDALSTRRFKFD